VTPHALVAKHTHLFIRHPLCLKPVRFFYVTFKHFQSLIKNKRVDKHMHGWRLKKERVKVGKKFLRRNCGDELG